MSLESVPLSIAWLLTSFTYIVHDSYMVLSLYSINTRLREKVWKSPNLESILPVCIVIPLYREDEDSIKKTFMSLAEQDYPHNLIRIIIVLEEGDKESLNIASANLPILTDAGYRAILKVKPPPRTTKALAINYVLRLCDEPVVGIYDGGDVILDRHQIRRAVAMIVSGYDGVGVRVIRGGSGTLSKFSTVDTTMWCDVTLPALKYAFNTALLSGEGLFVRKSALEAIGGFPESLTEDAHISLLFSQKGFMLALLDSTIYEGAPKSLKSMIRQKLRWHRGLFLCLRETLISKTPLSRKLTLTYTYSSPIVLVAIALSQVILTIGIAAPHLVPRPIFIWSLLVTFSTLSAPIYLALAKYRIPISVTLLMPLYWCAVGILTLYAFLCPWISWYKTSSRADFNPDRL